MINLKIQEKTMICNLDKFMSERELTIRKLASDIGITENTVRSYSKNRFNRIDCEVAVKLCNYFGVSVGEMFEIV